MIFTKEQLKILKNFSTNFNTNLMIKPEDDKTVFFTITYDKSSFAMYQFNQKLEIENPIYFYNATEFVNLIQTFTNYDIEVKDEYLVITNVDNKSKIKYSNLAEEITTLLEDYEKAKELLSTKDKPIAKFSLDISIFNDMKKVSSILKLNDIIIDVKKNKDIMLSVCNSNISDDLDVTDDIISPKNDTYDIIIDKESIIQKPSQTVKKVFDMESIKKLLTADYEITMYDKFIKFTDKSDDAELVYVFSYFS